MSDVRSEALPGLRITNGDGNPFGTFRMSASAWVAWAVAAFGIVLPVALLVDLVRTQARLGLPWSDGLAGDVLTAGAAGASILVAAYFGLVRPRLEVRSGGIRVVGFFDTLSVAWSEIERFDRGVRLEIHLHRAYVDWQDRDLTKTYVEVEALTVGAPRRLLGMGRHRRPVHGLDVLAGRLNAHLAAVRGGDRTGAPLSVDTAEGRRGIRALTLVLMAVGAVSLVLRLWLV